MREKGKCPKCGGEMEKGLRLFSFTEITVTNKDEYTGDRITLLHCKNCGYIEFYKEMKQ